MGCGQSYVEVTERFATQVKSAVNPDELQTWATNLIARTSPKSYDRAINAKAAGIPKGLLGLSDYPPDVWVSPSQDDSYVTIGYGDRMEHIGLYVGDKSFKAESDKLIYVVPWEPGIYFWHER